MKPGSWCEKPLWSCRQTCELQEVVQRRDRAAPRNLGRHLQPLCVLVEHRVDDVDEGLVAVEDAVPARQQVPLEPALAQMLRQDLDDAAFRREVLVGREDRCLPLTVGRREDVAEAVRRGLVRPEDAERLRVRRARRRRQTGRARASPRSSPSLDGPTGTAYARKSGRSRSRRRRPPLACGLALMRRSAAGASARSSGRSAPRSSNSSSGW